jgi:hypothetical protein
VSARDWTPQEIHDATVAAHAAMAERFADCFARDARESRASADKDVRRYAIVADAQERAARSIAKMLREGIVSFDEIERAAERRAREIMLGPFSLGPQVAAGGVRK